MPVRGVPVGENASLGKCQLKDTEPLGDKNLTLGWTFFPTITVNRQTKVLLFFLIFLEKFEYFLLPVVLPCSLEIFSHINNEKRIFSYFPEQLYIFLVCATPFGGIVGRVSLLGFRSLSLQGHLTDPSNRCSN